MYQPFKVAMIFALGTLALASLSLSAPSQAQPLPPIERGIGDCGEPPVLPSPRFGERRPVEPQPRCRPQPPSQPAISSNNAATSALCMLGMVQSGSVSGGCAAAVAEYFSFRVFDESGYDAPATAALRLVYLQGCTSCSSADLDAIQVAYGMVFGD